MRKVRPGEMPAPLSIWRWTPSGSPLLVLGLRKVEGASWGSQYVLRTLELSATPPGQTAGLGWIWTTATFDGMGRVLDEWVCVEEAPDVNILDD